MRKEVLRALTRRQLVGVNNNCKYYPCHFEGMDCTWCFCPFYPCNDPTLGETVSSKKTGRPVWSCKHCDWVHKREIAEKIFRELSKLSLNATRNIDRKDLLSLFIHLRREKPE